MPAAPLVLPATDDPALLDTFIQALASDLIAKPGKDVLGVVNIALRLLDAEHSPGTLVLLTDGADPAQFEALGQRLATARPAGAGAGGGQPGHRGAARCQGHAAPRCRGQCRAGPFRQAGPARPGQGRRCAAGQPDLERRRPGLDRTARPPALPGRDGRQCHAALEGCRLLAVLAVAVAGPGRPAQRLAGELAGRPCRAVCVGR
jgi:hypothetical protein